MRVWGCVEIEFFGVVYKRLLDIIVSFYRIIWTWVAINIEKTVYHNYDIIPDPTGKFLDKYRSPVGDISCI